MEGGYPTVLAALTERELVVNSWGDTVSARCPSHDDTAPSLSLKEGADGKALLFCHAGCSILDIASALELSMSDLFKGSSSGAVVATYEYLDESDEPLYRVLRLSPKGFFQERWEDGEWKPRLREVRRVPYRLSSLCEAVSNKDVVYIVEGEKDADNLAAKHDVCTTTLLGGANKWRDEYARYFQGARIIIIGDSDEAGRLNVTTLKARLAGVADSIRVYYPALGKDISDHLLAGLSLEDLVPEGEGLDEFKPLDWEHYEVPETKWLYEPYIPRHSRVLAFGPAGSLKSLWSMWVATKLAEEGKQVAYFSLEMLPSQTAQRLKQLKPPRENFKVFTSLRLGSPEHTNALIAGLKGTDLIIIDSWSSARAGMSDSNAEIASLDTDVFMPLITLTGASVLILDNTGHAIFTDKGKHKADHARGASAKGDKMEVTLWFDRPWEDDNHSTMITVKKMRLDHPLPRPVTIKTPTDRIEFYHTNELGVMTQPAWKGLQVMPEPMDTGVDGMDASSGTEASPESSGLDWKETESSSSNQEESATSSGTSVLPSELTPAERRALARLKDKFKELEE